MGPLGSFIQLCGARKWYSGRSGSPAIRAESTASVSQSPRGARSAAEPYPIASRNCLRLSVTREPPQEREVCEQSLCHVCRTSAKFNRTLLRRSQLERIRIFARSAAWQADFEGLRALRPLQFVCRSDELNRTNRQRTALVRPAQRTNRSSPVCRAGQTNRVDIRALRCKTKILSRIRLHVRIVKCASHHLSWPF